MFINANGIAMHCRIDGPSDAPPVVFGHALATDVGMWQPQVDAIGGRCRTIRLDFRGHGQTSGAMDGYDFDTLAEDTAALIAALDLGPVHYVGLSMGGVVGMKLALKYPELVSALVLSNTRSEVDEAFQRNCVARIEAAQHGGLASLVEPTMRRWFPEHLATSQADELLQIRAAFVNTSLEAYVAYCADLKRLDITGDLGRLDMPVLLVGGKHDKTTPPDVLGRIHDAINGSQLTIFDDCAHFPNIERPGLFNDALANFLESARPTRS